MGKNCAGVRMIIFFVSSQIKQMLVTANAAMRSLLKIPAARLVRLETLVILRSS